MNEFQKSISQCLDDILQHDPTIFLATGFNALITTHIPSIVNAHGTVTALHNDLKYTLAVTDPITHNSPTTNSDCFDFALSQTLVVTAQITLSVVPVQDVKGQFISLADPTIISRVRTPIFKLPVTLGRNLLYTPAFDDIDLTNQWLPPGSIICHGKLRCLPPVKMMRNNEILLIREKEFSRVQIRSAHHSKPFRYTSTFNFLIMDNNKKSCYEGVISCTLPYSDQTIHVGIIAQAFDCSPKQFIRVLKLLMGDLYDPVVFLPYELSLLYDASILKVTSQEEAILHISKLFGDGEAKYSTGFNQLKTEIFPHLNILYDEVAEVKLLHRAKLIYLTRCAGLAILFAARKIDDTPRDFFRNSWMMTPAHYIGTLIRKLFKDHMEIRQRLLRSALTLNFKKPKEEQTYINLVVLFGEVKLSSRIISPIANGSWSKTKKGVTISLNSGNPEGHLGELTRCSSSMRQTGSTNTNARQVQMDSFGEICASTTQDGEYVGLSMQLGILSSVTDDFEQPRVLSELLELLLKDFLIPIDLDESTTPSNHFLYFNNCGILTHFIQFDRIKSFVSFFRKSRRNGNIPHLTFIEQYTLRKEIHISNNGGQIMRPLVVVENLHLANFTLGFFEMLRQGIIEYVNAAECDTLCFVANSYDDYQHSLRFGVNVTHIDLTEASFVSLQLASVSFLTSQHGPRTSHYAQQIKQKITADIKRQMGVVLHSQLYYAFSSLTSTWLGLHLPIQSHGSDQPFVLAFYAEDNEDDSLKTNKAAHERGLGNALTIRYYSSDASPVQPANRKNKTVKEQFVKPTHVISKQNLDYSTVGDNGIPKKGTFIPGGGIVIAKIKTVRNTIPFTTNKKVSDGGNGGGGKTITIVNDISTSSRLDESGYVGRVTRQTTPNGEKVTVPIETTRFPQEGDKWSTRYAGKGVSSCIEYQENMIYSIETGQSPDMLVSGLSVTSRMIVSALLELEIAKAVAATGDISLGIDYQNFETKNEFKIEEVGQLLHRCGYTNDACETYIHGQTGEMLKCRICTGIANVSRLIHLASKKLHTRDFGPRDPITRTPRIGRLNRGGLKFGEMEKDCMASYGAAYYLECVSKKLTDLHSVYICATCKLLAEGYSKNELNFTWCRGCRQRRNVYLVEIPFTFLVMITELIAMGIVVRIAVTPDDLLLQKKKAPWNEDFWLSLFKKKSETSKKKDV